MFIRTVTLYQIFTAKLQTFHLRIKLLNNQNFVVHVSQNSTLQDVIKLIPENLFLYPQELKTLMFFEAVNGDIRNKKYLKLDTQYQNIQHEKESIVKQVFLSVLFPNLSGFDELFNHDELKIRFRLSVPEPLSENYIKLILMQQVDLFANSTFFAHNELNYGKIQLLCTQMIQFLQIKDSSQIDEFLRQSKIYESLSPTELVTLVSSCEEATINDLPHKLILTLCQFKFFQCLVIQAINYEAEFVGKEIVPKSREKNYETGQYIYPGQRNCLLVLSITHLKIFDPMGTEQYADWKLSQIKQILYLVDGITFLLVNNNAINFYIGDQNAQNTQFLVQQWINMVALTKWQSDQ